MSHDSHSESFQHRAVFNWCLNWKVALPVVGVLLLISAPFAFRMYQLSNVPVEPEPFDVDAFSAVEIAPEVNAALSYLEAIREFAITRRIEDQLLDATDRGFHEEHSEARDFLMSHQAAFATWRTGVSRPHFEVEPPRELSFASSFDVAMKIRHLSRITVAEARRLADEGEVARAWSVLIDTYRMALQLGKRGPSTEWLVGAAVRAAATQEMIRWAEDPSVDEILLARANREFELQLARIPKPSETLKCEYLMAQITLSRPELVSRIRAAGAPSTHGELVMWFFGEPELSLRIIRSVYANLLAHCDRPLREQPPRAGRFKLWELDPSGTASTRPDSDEAATGSGPVATGSGPRIYSPQEIDRMVAHSVMVHLFLGSLEFVQEVVQREDVRARNLRLAFALQRHLRRTGRFPAALSELVTQKLLDEVPADPFAEPYPQSMSYRLAPDGVSTWSVGPANSVSPDVPVDGKYDSYINRTYHPGQRPVPPPAATPPRTAPVPEATAPTSTIEPAVPASSDPNGTAK